VLTGWADTNPHLAFIGGSCSFLFGPLLYFYTQSVVYRGYRLPRTAVLHAVPFLLVTGLIVVVYHAQPLPTKLFILAARKRYDNPWLVFALSFAGYAQIVAYIVAALRTVRGYRLALQERFSRADAVNLHWLTSTLRGFMLSLLFAFGYTSVQLTPFTGYYEFPLAVIIVALFYFINGIIFKALRQPEIFGGVAPDELAPEATKPVKYASSALTASERESHLAGLRTWMDTQKPYLDPDLTIEGLSGQLDVPVKVLSQVINESLGQNFFDFVNTYRVEEAKRLLNNPRDPKVTVLEVMYQAGFNSKSSFNTAFKKIALTTPSAYKKKALEIGAEG
jgi:AraC-like DNA-binding protein